MWSGWNRCDASLCKPEQRTDREQERQGEREAGFPSLPGSYILVLRSDHQAVIPIGRLGAGTVTPGWYLYTGSALGAGGLRGRLQHHLRPVARPHWHIDFLRQVCAVTAVWYAVGERRWEHDWAGLLAQQAQPAPCPGFGASDCRCIAHCFFLSKKPSPVQFVADAQRLHPDHPAVEQRIIEASERTAQQTFNQALNWI